MSEIRLQKFLANSGICSRRKAEEKILNGEIIVNGKVIDELGYKVDINRDEIKYKGQIIKLKSEFKYILLNKPIGYVTTVKEQFNRPTVIDLIKEKNNNLLPVGRLDMYTSGALILTNDGDFIYKITHPKNEIEKTYIVTVRGVISNGDAEKLRQGVKIDDYISGKAKVKILKIDNVKNQSRIEIIIHEGKNREVRKMCEAVGKNVIALHRSKIAGLSIKELKIAEYRELSEKEVKEIKNYCKNT